MLKIIDCFSGEDKHLVVLNMSANHVKLFIPYLHV